MRHIPIAFLSLAATALVGAASTFVACSGDDSSTGGSGDAGQDVTTYPDAGSPDTSKGTETGPGMEGGGGTEGGMMEAGNNDGGVDRGPTTLNIDPTGDADPESLWWDDAKQILYIADNENNQIWTWTDTAGFVKHATTLDNPAADDAGATDVGQIIELSDGTLLVPRFGFGQFGAILTVSPDGGKAAVPNVNATLKHLGVTVDPSGHLWSGTFTSSSIGAGQVNTLSLTKGEKTYATGFGKVVGLLALGGQVLVSDQTQGFIFALPTDGGFPDGGPYSVYATVSSPDNLAAGPSGTIFTDMHEPLVDGGPLEIRQIAPDGGVTVFAGADGSLTEPSGVAYDPTNKRLFITDSNGTTVRTIKIYPVN